MAKITKDKWLGARIDANMDERVKSYTEATHMDMGELVRHAVDEYMLNHPIKAEKPESPTNINKPGGE